MTYQLDPHETISAQGRNDGKDIVQRTWLVGKREVGISTEVTRKSI